MKPVEPERPCWICGAPADSSEHKFKHAIIRELYGTQPWQDGSELGFVTTENARVLQSTDSKRLKYPKSICAQCNTTRTQASDHAFQAFWRHTINAFQSIEERRVIDLADLEINAMDELRVGIRRYLGKLFGCELSWRGWPIPHGLAQFVSGERADSDLLVWCVINEDLYRFEEPMKILARVRPIVFGKQPPQAVDGYAWALCLGLLRLYIAWGSGKSQCRHEPWMEPSEQIPVGIESFATPQDGVFFDHQSSDANLLTDLQWVLNFISRSPWDGRNDAP